MKEIYANKIKSESQNSPTKNVVPTIDISTVRKVAKEMKNTKTYQYFNHSLLEEKTVELVNKIDILLGRKDILTFENSKLILENIKNQYIPRLVTLFNNTPEEQRNTKVINNKSIIDNIEDNLNFVLSEINRIQLDITKENSQSVVIISKTLESLFSDKHIV